MFTLIADFAFFRYMRDTRFDYYAIILLRMRKGKRAMRRGARRKEAHAQAAAARRRSLHLRRVYVKRPDFLHAKYYAYALRVSDKRRATEAQDKVTVPPK